MPPVHRHGCSPAAVEGTGYSKDYHRMWGAEMGTTAARHGLYMVV
jgi:hypothetical protein